MNLTNEQFQAAERGEAVKVEHNGKEFYLLAAEVYERAKRALTDEPPSADEIYELMEQVMAEDDANDPALESYQHYKTRS
jgi:hypothetical protein